MGTKHTRLRIVNETNTDIINTSVSEYAEFDWDWGQGPHTNFRGVFIGSKKSVEHREEIKEKASHCPFTMTLFFRDGTRDTFRVHQKHAVGCCSGWQIRDQSHNLELAVVDGNCLKVTVYNTEPQLQNEKAEQLKKEGEAAMRQQQYELAMRKFEEASRLANQSSTINSISASRAAAAAAEESYHKERAEKLKKEGDEAMKQKQYETANDKYERALDSEKDRESANQMKASKGEALHEMAKAAFQEAWDFEADMSRDKSNAAKNMFNQARARFQAARNLACTDEVLEGLKLVDVKIEANRLFNEANELEKEAYEMFQKARESEVFDNSAQNKYKEAKEKYQKAKNKFEEGSKMNDARFDACIQITNEYIENVDKVIDDIDKAELKHNISKVKIEDKEENKTTNEEEIDIRPDLHEQIDVLQN